MSSKRPYMPAAGHDVFLPLYDPIVRLFGFGTALERLLEQAELRPGQRVLDVGCGTGNVAVAIGRRHPEIVVVGLDPDPKALAIAQRKAERARVAVRFDRGFGDTMPYGDGAFDRVFSSMMFHHLPKDARPKVLGEIRRVLAPGGRLEFLDFAGGTHNVLAQMLHGRQLSAAAEERLLRRLRDAGFVEARRVGDHGTVFGRVAYYQALV